MTVSKRILGLSDSKSVFVPSWKRPEFFELIKALSQKDNPKICYIGAARGDNPERIAEFFELSNRVSFTPNALKLFNMVTDDPKAYFADADVIFIDGGATRNLIALMREWGALAPLQHAYERGTLLVGASAGISMLFDWCVSDSIRTQILPVRGIGLLAGTVCAHYDASADRRAVLQTMLHGTKNGLPGYGLEDGVGVLFEDGKLSSVFTTEDGGKAHVFDTIDGGVTHRMIEGVSTKSGLEVGKSEIEPISE